MPQLKKWLLIQIILSIVGTGLLFFFFSSHTAIGFFLGAFLTTLNISFYAIFCYFVLNSPQKKAFWFFLTLMPLKYCLLLVVIWQVVQSVNTVWFLVGLSSLVITNFIFIPFLKR